jgi:hypothetical protein
MIWGDVTVSAVRNEDGSVRHRIVQILDVSSEQDGDEGDGGGAADRPRRRLDLATGVVA